MADHQAGTGNTAQIEFWNSAATRPWADQYARMDRAVAALTKELLDLAAPQPGDRWLRDICAKHMTARTDMFRQLENGRAGTATDIEYALARLGRRQIQQLLR